MPVNQMNKNSYKTLKLLSKYESQDTASKIKNKNNYINWKLPSNQLNIKNLPVK